MVSWNKRLFTTWNLVPLIQILSTLFPGKRKHNFPMVATWKTLWRFILGIEKHYLQSSWDRRLRGEDVQITDSMQSINSSQFCSIFAHHFITFLFQWVEKSSEFSIGAPNPSKTISKPNGQQDHTKLISYKQHLGNNHTSHLWSQGWGNVLPRGWKLPEYAT